MARLNRTGLKRSVSFEYPKKKLTRLEQRHVKVSPPIAPIICVGHRRSGVCSSIPLVLLVSRVLALASLCVTNAVETSALNRFEQCGIARL